MDRNKKKRSAAKNVVKGLVVKMKELIENSDKCGEVETMKNTIEVKMKSISTMDDEILNEVNSFMTVENGDVIMTGTPKGVGEIFKNQVFKGIIKEKNEIIIEQEWIVDEF